MRPTRPARLAAATIAAVALVACSSGDATEDPTPTDTTTSEASETPTPDETTSSASPSATETEGMTVEEAQDIVDATTAVYNDAVIRMLTEQRIGQQWYEQMRNIYEDPMVELIEAAWMSAAREQFASYDTDDPSGLVDRVIDVINDDGACFVVNIERDFTGVTAEGAENVTDVSDDYYLAFRAANVTDDRDGGGTGWLRMWDVESEDGAPENLCRQENPGRGGGE